MHEGEGEKEKKLLKDTTFNGVNMQFQDGLYVPLSFKITWQCSSCSNNLKQVYLTKQSITTTGF